MKKTNYYVLSLLMAAGLAACSAEIDGGGNDGLTPISLTATVEDAETTRAGTAVNNAFSSGDAFTAYFPENVRIGNDTETSSTTFNYNGTKWTPTTQPYFNAGTTNATIHAYYGKVGGASGTQVTNSTTKFTVATNQSTDAGYKASDLMYATNTINKASPTTALTFSHKMAKIIVNATAGDGISQIQAVRIIGGHRSIDVTMPGCTLGTTLSDENSPSSYITMYSGGTTNNAQCAALVVPETSGFTGDFLEIVTDQGSVKYSLTNKVLNSGKSYTFVLAVTAAAIGSTVAITGWTDSADATVTAGGGDFIMGDIAAQTYNGSAKTPTPTVSYGGNALTLDTHYTLQYVNNTNPGTAAVIAIGQGSYVGKVGVKEFTINKAAGSISYASTTVSKTYGNAAFTNTLTKTGDGTVTYSSSNTAVASVNASSGQVTINKAGSATITATVVDGTNYSYATKTASYTLNVAKANCTVQLSATSLTIAPSNSSTFTVTRSGNGTITASSSNNSVATTSVNQSTGVVTVNKLTTGTATITVTVAESDNYNAYTTTNKQVTVTSNPPLAELTSSAVGKLIGADGIVYDNATEATNAGTSADAMIVYVGNAGTADASSATYKGLAVALTDASTSATWYTANSGTCVYQNSTLSEHTSYKDMKGIANTNQMADKTGTCSGHTHAAATSAKNYSSTVDVPANCSQWFLPSSGQWMRMLQGSFSITFSSWNSYVSDDQTNYNNIKAKFTAAGVESSMFANDALYWSSSESSTDRAVYVRFNGSYGVLVNGSPKIYTLRVRAFLAF